MAVDQQEMQRASPISTELAVAAELPEGIGGMADAVRHVAAKLLDERHYQVLHRVLSSRWDRLHSLSAAVKLMEQHGVGLTPEEVERLSTMTEDRQINVLVSKMPMQTAEQFQHFFLQLQLLVSTATRIRRGLEEGNPNLVAETLDSAESTGIASDVLRMAVVQAGTEVRLQKQLYADWVKEADSRTSRLVRAQEDASAVEKKLAAVQAEMAKYQLANLEKSKKFLMSFAANFSAGLLIGCLKGWVAIVKYAKQEAIVRLEYADRIEEATTNLAVSMAARVTMIRHMMEKKGSKLTTELLSEIMEIWTQVAKEEKFQRDSAAAVAAMAARLAAAQGSQAEKAKQFLTHMGAKNEGMLVSVCFQGWIQDYEDFKKEKEHEEEVRLKQEKMAEFLKGKSDNAKRMLQMVGGSTNTGLLTSVVTAWKQAVEDTKKEAEIDRAVCSTAAKLAAFKTRSKGHAGLATGKTIMSLEEMLKIQVLNAWRLDSRLEATLKLHHAKVESKRQQLLGVQQMFRTFAHQLDTRLKGSFDSDRTSGKRLNKTEGTVSLPDIRKPSGKVATPTKMPSARMMPLDVTSNKRDRGHSGHVAEPGAYPQAKTAWG